MVKGAGPRPSLVIVTLISLVSAFPDAGVCVDEFRICSATAGSRGASWAAIVMKNLAICYGHLRPS